MIDLSEGDAQLIAAWVACLHVVGSHRTSAVGGARRIALPRRISQVAGTTSCQGSCNVPCLARG